MVTIEIGNSYSQIKGMSASQEKELRKVLSYLPNPQAAYFSGGFNRPKYLIDKKGYFPTGLWQLVSSIITNANIVDKRIRPRSTPGMFRLQLDNKPYEWQTNAADKAIGHHRGGIQAVTGSGKSLLIALIASRLNVRTLVVVPSLEIRKQLQEAINAWFGNTKNIVVHNIDSKALLTAKGFDCLIIDECHHAAARTYQKLNKTVWKDIYYRYFLTATFYRNQDHEKLLFEGIAGQLIYKLSYQEAISKRYIVPVEAYYIDLPKRTTDAHTWSQVYSELVVNNEYRNKVIAEAITHLPNVLCLVKEVAHGKKLSELSGIPFVSGEDDESRDYIRQFNAGGIDRLIGTTGVISEGVDTKPCEYVVLCGLGKAKSAFVQAVGRGVRRYTGKESAKIVIFKDRSHRFTLRHFNEQKKILLDEFGVVPVKLDIE